MNPDTTKPGVTFNSGVLVGIGRAASFVAGPGALGGKDTIYGNVGNDLIIGGFDNDHIYGGNGVFAADGVTPNLPITLGGGVSDADLLIGDNAELINVQLRPLTFHPNDP